MMTSLDLAYMMDRIFSLVTLLVEEAERRYLVVVLGSLLWPWEACCHPLEGKMGLEPPLRHLICPRAGQGSAVTISFL